MHELHVTTYEAYVAGEQISFYKETDSNMSSDNFPCTGTHNFLRHNV
jgi:hypothetical protein